MTLAPGETATLSFILAPSSVGEKTATFNLVGGDETVFGTLELSGNALDMLPTNVVATLTDATISATNVLPGDSLEISCKIANEGSNFADYATVSFYASTDPNDITSGTFLGDAYTCDWIAAGEIGDRRNVDSCLPGTARRRILYRLENRLRQRLESGRRRALRSVDARFDD